MPRTSAPSCSATRCSTWPPTAAPAPVIASPSSSRPACGVSARRSPSSLLRAGRNTNETAGPRARRFFCPYCAPMSVIAVERSAWRALCAAQLGWMLDAMDFLLFTYALRPIQKEFALSDATIGLVATSALVASGLGGILFGRLADRIGRVRAMTFSILLYSGATAGLATSGALWQLVMWRVLVGLGMGGEWTCGSLLVAETWPAQHRPKAMGLMQSGWAIRAPF